MGDCDVDRSSDGARLAAAAPRKTGRARRQFALAVAMAAFLALSSRVSAQGPLPAPPKPIRDEYGQQVQKADPENNPEAHRGLADWCRRKRWKEGQEYHLHAFNVHDFDRKLAAAGEDAGVRELRNLLALAQKLGLEDRALAMRQRLLAAEVAERRGKLADNDAPGLRALLQWAQKEGADEALAAELARAVLALDPQDAHANRTLGHLQGENGKWVDPWRLLVERGGLKDVKVRYQIHRMVAESQGPQTKTYQPNPYFGLKQVPAALLGGKVQLWHGAIRGHGDGAGELFVWTPKGYDHKRAWPLIVYLHGGGSGGLGYARTAASNILGAWTLFAAPQTADYVMIAPLVRNHVMMGWERRENLVDAIDAIIDACDRFNIDRTRIYLAGFSMGGGGVGRLGWDVPEGFAAFSPQAGAFSNRGQVPDLDGKGFFVVHGAQDRACPVRLAHAFVAKSREAGAHVEYLEFPEAAHDLPFFHKYLPQMFEFFQARQNPITPDLRLVRRIVAGE